MAYGTANSYARPRRRRRKRKSHYGVLALVIVLLIALIVLAVKLVTTAVSAVIGRTGTHEIVYAIGEESLWGPGYGKGAVRSALSAAFLDSRAERVIARIDPENTRSIRSVCACGFSRCGKEGKLHLYDLTQERYLENLRASYAQKRAEG